VEFRKRYYQEALRAIMCDSRETVPAALAMFWLAGGDAVKTTEYAANFGRDTDTIATMAGALAGAFGGMSALRPEWRAKFEQTGAMEKQQQLAARLINVCRTKAQEQATFLRVYPC